MKDPETASVKLWIAQRLAEILIAERLPMPDRVVTCNLIATPVFICMYLSVV